MRATTDHYPKLTISYLKSLGCFQDREEVEFDYTFEIRAGENRFKLRLALISTPCHFGGKRWWFRCPINRKRCAILFIRPNGMIGSRNGLNLVYKSQTQSKRQRWFDRMMCLNACKAIALYRTIKCPFRKGKPTRKLKRFIKLSSNNPSPKEIQEFEFIDRRKKKGNPYTEYAD